MGIPKDLPQLIPLHGGYRTSQSYQMAEIVFDATVAFCDRFIDFIDRRSRTHDRMVQAARNDKQNIAEGSTASGTSKKTELKLIGVARASLEELLVDFQEFLRQQKLSLWSKGYAKAKGIRALAYRSYRSYLTYKTYFEDSSPEVAANAVVCLIYPKNYLLDQQLRALEKEFSKECGFAEKLYRVRTKLRKGK